MNLNKSPKMHTFHHVSNPIFSNSKNNHSSTTMNSPSIKIEQFSVPDFSQMPTQEQQYNNFVSCADTIFQLFKNNSVWENHFANLLNNFPPFSHTFAAKEKELTVVHYDFYEFLKDPKLTVLLIQFYQSLFANAVQLEEFLTNNNLLNEFVLLNLNVKFVVDEEGDRKSIGDSNMSRLSMAPNLYSSVGSKSLNQQIKSEMSVSARNPSEQEECRLNFKQSNLACNQTDKNSLLEVIDTGIQMDKQSRQHHSPFGKSSDNSEYLGHHFIVNNLAEGIDDLMTFSKNKSKQGLGQHQQTGLVGQLNQNNPNVFWKTGHVEEIQEDQNQEDEIERGGSQQLNPQNQTGFGQCSKGRMEIEREEREGVDGGFDQTRQAQHQNSQLHWSTGQIIEQNDHQKMQIESKQSPSPNDKQVIGNDYYKKTPNLPNSNVKVNQEMMWSNVAVQNSQTMDSKLKDLSSNGKYKGKGFLNDSTLRENNDLSGRKIDFIKEGPISEFFDFGAINLAEKSKSKQTFRINQTESKISKDGMSKEAIFGVSEKKQSQTRVNEQESMFSR